MQINIACLLEPHFLRLHTEEYATVFTKNKVNLLFFQLVILTGEKLSKAVTVSTKIPTELKEKLKQLKIKPSKLLRKAIEDEIRRREAQKLKEDIEKLKPTLDRVSIDDIVKSIREDRTNR